MDLCINCAAHVVMFGVLTKIIYFLHKHNPLCDITHKFCYFSLQLQLAYAVKEKDCSQCLLSGTSAWIINFG